MVNAQWPLMHREDPLNFVEVLMCPWNQYRWQLKYEVYSSEKLEAILAMTVWSGLHV
jgi:hypothetical protein